jgi:hypothetical protein
MSILRKKSDKLIEIEKEAGNPNPYPYLPVPDFTYSSDCLAQVIVDAWVDAHYRHELLHRDPGGIVPPAAVHLATRSVNSCGFNLERAVVISEAEYFDGYVQQAPSEVVFVLPDHDRVKFHPSGKSLLETAKLLMATTPNGI